MFATKSIDWLNLLKGGQEWDVISVAHNLNTHVTTDNENDAMEFSFPFFI